MANDQLADGDGVTTARLNDIVIGTTAPSSPFTGQLWNDTSGSAPLLKSYNGSVFVVVAPDDWLAYIYMN